MSWKQAYIEHVREQCKVPPGAKTVEQIAVEDLDVSPDKARDILNALVRAGKAEKIEGKAVGANGAVCRISYYREIPKSQRTEAESVTKKPVKK